MLTLVSLKIIVIVHIRDNEWVGIESNISSYYDCIWIVSGPIKTKGLRDLFVTIYSIQHDIKKTLILRVLSAKESLNSLVILQF